MDRRLDLGELVNLALAESEGHAATAAHLHEQLHRHRRDGRSLAEVPSLELLAQHELSDARDLARSFQAWGLRHVGATAAGVHFHRALRDPPGPVPVKLPTTGIRVAGAAASAVAARIGGRVPTERRQRSAHDVAYHRLAKRVQAAPEVFRIMVRPDDISDCWSVSGAVYEPVFVEAAHGGFAAHWHGPERQMSWRATSKDGLYVDVVEGIRLELDDESVVVSR